MSPTPLIVPTATETKPSWVMVLKNLPSDLTVRFEDTFCKKKIVEVQDRKDNWQVVTASKANAETFARVFRNSNISLTVIIRNLFHLGIAQFVPNNINDELCALIPQCVSPRQIGNTHLIWLKFETKVDLKNAIIILQSSWISHPPSEIFQVSSLWASIHKL